LRLQIFGGTDSTEPLCTVISEPEWDVDDLKEAILEAQDVPKMEQRLFAFGRMLQNCDELGIVFAGKVTAGDEGGLPVVRVELERVDEQFMTEYDYICSGILKLTEAPVAHRSDRWSVLAAVQRNGQHLQYASEELRDDEEIVLEAVQRDGLAIKYAAKRFVDHKQVVIAAVIRNGYVLEFVSDELRNDREVVCAAVQKDGRALELASEALRTDPEVLKCVSIPLTKIGA